MLCWEEHSRHIDTQEEVWCLTSVFKNSFGYSVTIVLLDAKAEESATG